MHRISWRVIATAGKQMLHPSWGWHSEGAALLVFSYLVSIEMTGFLEWGAAQVLASQKVHAHAALFVTAKGPN